MRNGPGVPRGNIVGALLPFALVSLAVLSTVFFGFLAPLRSQVLNYLEKKKPAPYEAIEVGNGIFMVKGGWGSHIGVCVWNDEVLVIDSKSTVESTKKALVELAKVTGNPITRVVFTHSDPDSFNGREAFPDRATVICSFNALEEHRKNATVYLESDTPAQVYGSWPRADFFPSITFAGRLDIRIGKKTVALVHHGAAHTSGDVVVWFPDDRLAFIGDLVFPGREPLIQDQKGGNSFALVRVLSILLDLKPQIRTFIPSHGDPVGRDVVLKSRYLIEDIHDKVTALYDSGKSLEEMKELLGIREPRESAGHWFWPSLAVTVYRELSEKDANRLPGSRTFR